MPLPLVLLSGLNTTPEVWNEVMFLLPAERACLALECAAENSVEAIADKVAAIAPHRFHLVGFSLGGYVALALVERHRERLESLVLVSSAADADNDAQRAFRETCLEAVARGEHELLNERGAALTLHEQSAANPELMGRYLSMMRAYGAERFAAHTRACRDRADRSEILASANLPTLCIAGEEDRVVSIKRQLKTAAAAAADLEIVAGAGHQLPLEQPKALAETLTLWLQSRP